MLWTQNLAARFTEFAASARGTLYVIAPFIRADALARVLGNVSAPEVTVVTTWRTADVLAGASDPALYPYCRARRWFVYVHPFLHAKILAADGRRAIATSANITGSALGLVAPGNVECAVPVACLSRADLVWLGRIVADAQLVSDAYYEAFVRHIETQRDAVTNQTPAPFDASAFEGRRHFLLSSLPMSDVPERVLQYIATSQGGEEGLAIDEDAACALHDISLYELRLDADALENRSLLRERFFSHPFISAFAAFVEERRFFGEAKAWVQDNCANVPVPRRRDLTGYVRVLFDWFVALGDGEYAIDRPGHSECLVRGASSVVGGDRRLRARPIR